MRQSRQTGERAQPLTISPKTRPFSSTGQRERFYEGYLQHTNGGSFRYVVFDYVAYGGAQLAT
jgi:hypothetical protein